METRLLPVTHGKEKVSSGEADGTGRSTTRPSLRAETQLERGSQQRGQAASRDDLTGTVQCRVTSRGDPFCPQIHQTMTSSGLGYSEDSRARVERLSKSPQSLGPLGCGTRWVWDQWVWDQLGSGPRGLGTTRVGDHGPVGLETRWVRDRWGFGLVGFGTRDHMGEGPVGFGTTWVSI